MPASVLPSPVELQDVFYSEVTHFGTCSQSEKLPFSIYSCLFSLPHFALSVIHFVADFQHPPTSTAGLSEQLGNSIGWSRNVITSPTRLHSPCQWDASTGSPGTGSMIYANPVPWLNSGPRGRKKNGTAQRESSWCSQLANLGLEVGGKDHRCQAKFA